MHAASLQDGEPLAGVALSVLDAKGEAVVAGATDDERQRAARVRARTPSTCWSRAHGKDVSLLPFNQPALDLSDFAVAGRKEAWFDVFGWADRDLYRPGETMRLSALLRDHDGNPIKPQPLFVTLKQPDGRPYAEAQLDPKELNYFEWSREIPADAPTGRWQVEFRTDPKSKEATQGLTFRIEEFLPERLKLDLSTRRSRDQARRAAQARGRSRLSLWRAGRGQPLHGAADARARPASGRTRTRISSSAIRRSSCRRKPRTSSTKSSTSTASSAGRRARRRREAGGAGRRDRLRQRLRIRRAHGLAHAQAHGVAGRRAGRRAAAVRSQGWLRRARARRFRSHAQQCERRSPRRRASQADARARATRLSLDLRQRKRLAFRLHRPLRKFRNARARRRRRHRR